MVLTLNPMDSSFNKLLTFKTFITALMIMVFSINLLLVERVDGLSDSRQLVLDAWTLVNEGFYDPEKFDDCLLYTSDAADE